MSPGKISRAGILIAIGLGAAARGKAEAVGDITHANAAIHQEVTFAAPPSRVYEVLITTTLFDKVVRASFGMKSSMMGALGKAPTAIDPQPGGAFTLFGGYITGRNLELVRDVRLVQGWHAASWDPGRFSIAKFALSAHGSGTKLVFDHTGFPNEDTTHLALGWYEHYWNPLRKVLAT
jgi:activator of HSP90 ATPase